MTGSEGIMLEAQAAPTGNVEGGKSEVEAKVLNVNKSEVVSALERTGAKLVFRGEIVNVILDTPDNKLKEIGFNARVRKVTPHVLDEATQEWKPSDSYFVFTIKGRDSDTSENKERPEWDSPDKYETEAHALDALRTKLLAVTGINEPLVEVRRVTKERISYKYGADAENASLRNIQVDIDTISGVSVRGKTPEGASFPLPTLLEIEPDNPKEANEKIPDCARALNLELDAEERQWSEGDVLKHYGIRPR